MSDLFDCENWATPHHNKNISWSPRPLLATRANHWSFTQRLASYREEFSFFFLLRRQDEHLTSNDQPNPDTTKKQHDPTVQNKGIFFPPPPT